MPFALPGNGPKWAVAGKAGGWPGSGRAATRQLAWSLLRGCPAWLRRFLRGSWSLHRCSGSRQGRAMIAGWGGRQGYLWHGCRAAASNVLLASLHRCIHCMQCMGGEVAATKPRPCRAEAAEQASRSVRLSPTPIPVRSDDPPAGRATGRKPVRPRQKRENHLALPVVSVKCPA
jgi:hypothetical protein